MTDNIKNSIKIAIGAIFGIAALWDASLPGDEQLFGTLLDILFALIGGAGLSVIARMVADKKLVDK